jgi:hypothetical protein
VSLLQPGNALGAANCSALRPANALTTSSDRMATASAHSGPPTATKD